MSTGPLIGLGMPAPPAPTLAPRRKTRQLMVRDVGVGSDHPIAVQSMTTTKTHDINATLQQIAELTASGCDIVRVACPRQEDAEALPVIAKKSKIPVIADIDFLDPAVELLDVARVHPDGSTTGVDRGEDVLGLKVNVGDHRDLGLLGDHR